MSAQTFFYAASIDYLLVQSATGSFFRNPFHLFGGSLTLLGPRICDVGLVRRQAHDLSRQLGASERLLGLLPGSVLLEGHDPLLLELGVRQVGGGEH